MQYQPAYGQPAYGQPAYGQPAYGQPIYGQQQQFYSQPGQFIQPYGVATSTVTRVVSTPPTLYYWPVRARNYLIVVAAKAGGVALTEKK